MKRLLSTTMIAALCVFASPVLAQSASPPQDSANPGTARSQLGTLLENDRAAIEKDKAAIDRAKMSGSSAAEEQSKLGRDIEQQEVDRQAQDTGETGKH
jgi:hypothetical protein